MSERQTDRKKKERGLHWEVVWVSDLSVNEMWKWITNEDRNGGVSNLSIHSF